MSNIISKSISPVINEKTVEIIIKSRFGINIFQRNQKFHRASLSREERNRRVKIAKIKQAEEIKNDDRLLAIVKWIKEIQSKLKMNDKQFARALGLRDARSIRYLRNGEGHLPSKPTTVALLKLERLTKVKIERSDKENVSACEWMEGN